MAILLSWIGTNDYKAAENKTPAALAKTLTNKTYSDAYILLDEGTEEYWELLETYIKEDLGVPTSLIASHKKLKDNPTDYALIYAAAKQDLDLAIKRHGNEEFDFLLSSGTAAMATVWIILSAQRSDAKINLVQSSEEGGEVTVNFPFDLTADFQPEAIASRQAETIREAHAGAIVTADQDGAPLGDSKLFKDALQKVQRLAHLATPHLITGETGTGKEEVAKYIHSIYSAARGGDSKFLAMNCATGNGELIDSMLFGHEKGAFTGATERKIGFFEEAQGGTLFLDEIGELSLDGQARLLRVIQERKLTRVGSTKEINLDETQLIFATNRNLVKMISERTFREDLYYRMCMVEVELPPLREREGDIRLLADYFLDYAQREFPRGDKAFDPMAYEVLLGHPWPGNVRELRLVVYRAYLYCDKEVISAEEVRSHIGERQAAGLDDDLLNRPLSEYPRVRDELEAHYLTRGFSSGLTQTELGELLGMKQSTISTKKRKHNIK